MCKAMHQKHKPNEVGHAVHHIPTTVDRPSRYGKRGASGWQEGVRQAGEDGR